MVTSSEESNAGYGEYIVGYLDALGFTYLVESEELETIKNSLERIIIYYLKYKYSGEANIYWRLHKKKEIREKRLKWSNPDEDLFTFVNFSDSIFIYTKLEGDDVNRERSFYLVCEFINEVISKSVLKTDRPDMKSLAFRGAISMGDGYTNKADNIFFGYPFINAHDLGEKQDWMGCVIDEESIPIEWITKNVGYDQPIIKYNVPMKDDVFVESFVLNWPQGHWCEEKYKKNSNREGPHRSDIGRHVELFSWNDKAQKKMDNTLKFVDFICNLWDKNE